jgi:hypothetical protein
MPPTARRYSGTPTFIAASASLSLSGLEHFSPVTNSFMDPNVLDASHWYPNPGEPQHALLSPPHEHFSIDFDPGFASHSVPVSHEALHRRFERLVSPIPLRTFSYCADPLPKILSASMVTSHLYSTGDHLQSSIWRPGRRVRLCWGSKWCWMSSSR